MLPNEVDYLAACPDTNAEPGGPVGEDLFQDVLFEHEPASRSRRDLVLDEGQAGEMPPSAIPFQQPGKAGRLLLRLRERLGQATQPQGLRSAAVDPAQPEAPIPAGRPVGRLQDERIGSGQPELAGQQQADRSRTHDDHVVHSTPYLHRKYTL